MITDKQRIDRYTKSIETRLEKVLTEYEYLIKDWEVLWNNKYKDKRSDDEYCDTRKELYNVREELLKIKDMLINAQN